MRRIASTRSRRERSAPLSRGHGNEFTSLIAGTADDEAGKALLTLSGVYGYPTTILIDRKGEVRDIHTGFSGPATGAAYEEFVAEFPAHVEALLAKPPT